MAYYIEELPKRTLQTDNGYLSSLCWRKCHANLPLPLS